NDFPVVPTDCGNGHVDAVTLAQHAANPTDGSQPIHTYVLFLKNADFPTGGVPQVDQTNARAMVTDQNHYFFDATGDHLDQVAGSALATVAQDLGACVYEVPGGISSGAVISYFDYQSAQNVSATYSTDCKDESTEALPTSPKWVFDAQHIRLCPNTCANLK